MVADRQLGDARAETCRERGDEAVLIGIEGESVEQLSAVCLERATVVLDGNPCEPTDQAVGTPRRDAAQQQAVLPPLPPTADQVVSLLELVQDRRDIAGIVL